MEWHQHTFQENVNSDLPWDKYWLVVRDVATPTGEARYPALIKFVGILASLPFANMAVERIFSQLKLVKTDHRNSLKSASLVLLLQSNMSMKKGNWSAASLKPNGKMLEFASQVKLNATNDEVKKIRKEFLSKLL